MASSLMSSQLIVMLMAAVVAVAYAGFGPSADGEWTEADLVAYSVVVGVAGAIFIVAIMLYCQLQNFIKVGMIEERAQQAAQQAIAQQEAELKSQQVAAQKEKVRKDIAAQKAKQKTK